RGSRGGLGGRGHDERAARDQAPAGPGANVTVKNPFCFTSFSVNLFIHITTYRIDEDGMQHPVVLGFTGSFASGCSTTIKVIEENTPGETIRFSLSNCLREAIVGTQYEERLKVAKKFEQRQILQEAGTNIRKDKGADYLVKIVLKKINETENINNYKFILIDSIRNVKEIYSLRNELTNRVYIWAIYADEDIRWKRVIRDYEGKYDVFEQDDARDHNEKDIWGQQVDMCVYMADIMSQCEDDIISSKVDRLKYYKEKIWFNLDRISRPKDTNPSSEEIYMTMAYANAARSRCLQRKVGAVITTEHNEIVSLGHNDPPEMVQACKDAYEKCYRKKIKEEFLQKILQTMIKYCPNCGNEIKDNIICTNCSTDISKICYPGKNLGECVSIHAEERAIIEAAKTGIALNKGVIYTTTFPCNMCANRIASVGIQKVVYVEPYPEEKAKKILAKNEVIMQLFEGIKSRAYFDIFKTNQEIDIEVIAEDSKEKDRGE
ncbi:MAG: deaminase, partial [Methanobacteriota archaeon]